MDGIEPPSFSLGFDLDVVPEHQLPSERNPSSPVDCAIGNGDDELDLTIEDSDPESELGSSSRVLNRLRRGINIEPSSKGCYGVVADMLDRSDDRDDDIEEFSSPEDFRAEPPSSTRSQFSCISSKAPLHRLGNLSAKASSTQREKQKQLDVPVSAGSGISSVSSLFQRSTCSPLRRFQLLDSDSEEDQPSTSKDISRVIGLNGSSSKGKQPITSKKIESESTACTKDLWRDFSPQGFQIHTPALDDICRDYFSSMKENNTAQNRTDASRSINASEQFNSTGFKEAEISWDFGHPRPQSHRFFLHNDPKVRDLVRKRLPNFVPLGIANGSGTQQSLFLIDYMNQFGSKESSKTPISSSKSRSNGRSKPKVSRGQEGWMNPKTSSTAPKDAGKRRVSANSGTGGHWYTTPEGRKVYVSRSGQELSGASAYKCFKKENGGFKKSKRKGQTKNQTKKKKMKH